jgi:hypothetical protein
LAASGREKIFTVCLFTIAPNTGTTFFKTNKRGAAALVPLTALPLQKSAIAISALRLPS